MTQVQSVSMSQRAEKPSLPIYMERMMTFMRSTGSVYNYLIAGPIEDVPMMINVVAGLFVPRGNLDAIDLVILKNGTQDSNMSLWHQKILDLTIPDKIVHKIPNRDIEVDLKYCINQGLPFAVIGFGKQINSEEKITLLSAISTLQPVSVLKLFYEKSRERLIGLN